MRNLILIVLLSTLNLFAAIESSVLPSDVYADNNFKITQTCTPKCRNVNAGYRTKVIDFNPFTGITKCDIFTAEEKITAGLTADTLNNQCVTETSNDVPYSSSFASKGKEYGNLSSISYVEKLSMTKFLAGVVSLDDDYIDVKGTADTGVLDFSTGANIGTDTGTAKDNATIHKLNTYNLGYFISLFYNFQKIYTYILYILFIFVGAFFLFLYIFHLITAKLEDRKITNILSTVGVPLLMMFLCFVPIPKADSFTTTPIQEFIKYFTFESNELADRLSAVGTDVYVRKVFGSVGAHNLDGEKNILDKKLDLEKAVASYKNAYSNCLDRFKEIKTDNRTFQIEDEEEIAKLEKLKSEGAIDFTFAACKRIENALIFNERQLDEKNMMLQSISNAYNNNELQAKLSQINTATKERVNDYGWLYATFLSSISVVVENLSTISDSVESSATREKNVNLKEDKTTTDDDYMADVEIGAFAGQLAYMILPGAGEVHKVVSDRMGRAGKMVEALKEFPFVGFIANFVGKGMQISKSVAALYFTASLYDNILRYLPIIVGTVAGLIAFAVYLIDLFKYLYVAPFMVLYSVTMQKKGKIVEFFINGIGLFLKPILIVISIYLSLFFYYMFQDVFTEMILKQFELLDNLEVEKLNFINGLSLSLFATLLNIVISILVTYLMWKIIIDGSNWFLKVAGINDSDNISNSLSQRVDRYSFQV